LDKLKQRVDNTSAKRNMIDKRDSCRFPLSNLSGKLKTVSLKPQGY